MNKFLVSGLVGLGVIGTTATAVTLAGTGESNGFKSDIKAQKVLNYKKGQFNDGFSPGKCASKYFPNFELTNDKTTGGSSKNTNVFNGGSQGTRLGCLAVRGIKTTNSEGYGKGIFGLEVMLIKGDRAGLTSMGFRNSETEDKKINFAGVMFPMKKEEVWKSKDRVGFDAIGKDNTGDFLKQYFSTGIKDKDQKMGGFDPDGEKGCAFQSNQESCKSNLDLSNGIKSEEVGTGQEDSQGAEAFTSGHHNFNYGGSSSENVGKNFSLGQDRDNWKGTGTKENY